MALRYLSHAAIKTGMLAAEAAYAALDAGPTHDEQLGYPVAVEQSSLHEELNVARNFKPWMSKGLLTRTIKVGIDQILFRGNAPWTLRHKHVDQKCLRTRSGKLYAATTALTCLSRFFIFAHSGLGKSHALGIITLVVLALALVAERSAVFGRRAVPVATVAFSQTFYFHLISAVTETSTRLPVHSPLAAGAESPVLAAIFGLMFVIFLFGVWRQLRKPGDRNGKVDVREVTP